jgi:[ribosomal protein S5]-alanine N-acetyltransferase
MIWPLRDKQPVPVIEIKSERLVLRPAVASDYPQWKAVRQRSFSYLKPFEPAWPDGCLTRDFFDRRVKRLANDWENDRTYAYLILLHDGTLVGGININNVCRGAANYGSLGYWLDEQAQGHGYMTEAANAILNHAFKNLHFSRMNAATLPHNHKSRAMLRRLNFAEEGFAKNYIQIDGRRQDHVLYGLNAADYLGAAGYSR